MAASPVARSRPSESEHFWQNVLYRLSDDGGRLLYVGITNNLNRRFKAHQATQPWWDEVAHCRTEFFLSREELVHAEWQAIRDEAPLYNQSHSSTDAFLADAAAVARRRRTLSPPPRRCHPLDISGAPMPGHERCGVWADGYIDETCFVYRRWEVQTGDADESAAAVGDDAVDLIRKVGN